MIAVDTNVLLRRLLDDDATQSARARRLFDAEAEILITDVVLAEAVWTLKGKRYKASAAQVAEIVTGLLEEPNVVFEDAAAVWSALNDYVAAGSSTRPGPLQGFVKRHIVEPIPTTKPRWPWMA